MEEMQLMIVPDLIGSCQETRLSRGDCCVNYKETISTRCNSVDRPMCDYQLPQPQTICSHNITCQ